MVITCVMDPVMSHCDVTCMITMAQCVTIKNVTSISDVVIVVCSILMGWCCPISLLHLFSTVGTSKHQKAVQGATMLQGITLQSQMQDCLLDLGLYSAGVLQQSEP